MTAVASFREEQTAPRPIVSVAVSTFERAHLLERLVAALTQQTLPNDRFEVLIANKESTDNTRAVLAKLQDEAPVAIRTIHLDSEPRSGRRWIDMRLRPRTRNPFSKVTSLPGALDREVLEVIVMLRGSVRHRCLVL